MAKDTTISIAPEHDPLFISSAATNAALRDIAQRSETALEARLRIEADRVTNARDALAKARRIQTGVAAVSTDFAVSDDEWYHDFMPPSARTIARTSAEKVRDSILYGWYPTVDDENPKEYYVQQRKAMRRDLNKQLGLTFKGRFTNMLRLKPARPAAVTQQAAPDAAIVIA